MSVTIKRYPDPQQSALLGAALRYCAVADWFEALPLDDAVSFRQAMAIFDRAEDELRRLGRQAIREGGHRAALRQAAGIPGVPGIPGAGEAS